MRQLTSLLLIFCCSSCLLSSLLSERLAKDDPLYSTIVVVSKSNLFRMSFPATWGAIYKDISPACELYMTDGTSFCYVEVFPKQDSLEHLLASLRPATQSSTRSDDQVEVPRTACEEVKLQDTTNVEQLGYDTFHQTFLTAKVPDRALNNINTTLKVVEGKAHYYIISVGKLAAEVALNSDDKVQQYVLRSFTLLKDPLVSNFVDCILSDRFQQYAPPSLSKE